jgi:CBS domain-containing protein
MARGARAPPIAYQEYVVIEAPLPTLDVPVPAACGEPELALEPRHEPVAAPQWSAQESVAPADELQAHVSRPISEVMDETLWTVHAEDSIERVEEILAEQGLTSAPVVGSNGAIVGMIGAAELALFHADGKNPKAVQAWEISRIKRFEVSPGDSVEDVAKLMAENKIENISVTECGRLKGIVSTQDLLQDMLKGLPDDGANKA